MERLYKDVIIGYPDIIDFKCVKGKSGGHMPTFTLAHDENLTSLFVFYSWEDDKTKIFHEADIAFCISGLDVANFDEVKDIYYDVYDSLYEAFSEDPDQILFMDSLVTEILRRHSVPRR